MFQRKRTKIFGIGDHYIKFFWHEKSEGINNVAVAINGRFFENVLDVRRVKECVMHRKLVLGYTVCNVSVYAPKSVRDDSEKEAFFNTLGDTMLSIPDQEYTFLCGDLNGHQELNCKIVQFCFGFQNSEGHRHFNFRQSQNLAA